MNKKNNVNDAASAEAALSSSLRDIFAGISLLQEWDIRHAAAQSLDSGWDLIATGPLPGNTQGAFYIECKTNFTPSLFANLATRPLPPKHPRRSARVLAMPNVSPRLRELCSEHNWNWFDLAGNCRLELPGALYIERLGQTPVSLERTPRTNLTSPESNLILRALLAPENASRVWTQRDFASHFGALPLPIPAPSLALVNKVVQYLREEALLEALAPHGFRVVVPEKLFQRWRESNQHAKPRSLRAFTLLHGRALESRLLQLTTQLPGQAALASFSAADYQAPYLRQPRTFLAAHPSCRAEILKALEAKVVDSGENLIIHETEDPGIFYALDSRQGRPNCTNAAQTAFDLSFSPARSEEALEAILDRVLRPAWTGTRNRTHAN